jgi:hypothetical protein
MTSMEERYNAREVLFFYFVPDTTRDILYLFLLFNSQLVFFISMLVAY